MTREERERVVTRLASSEARLLALVEGLTPQQWHFRETEARWSIAEVIEHCVVFEEFIRAALIRVLAEPEEPEKRAGAAAKEALVMGLARSRNRKFSAREAVLPIGRWPDTAELVAELRKTRARSMVFVAKLEGDLRGHFFPHISFGDLDCYQWLVVLGQHGARHALQIEEIKRDARYPVE